MKADFLAVFNAFRLYLAGEVPELGNIITHWEDPFTAPKNRSILLPDGHSGTGGKITFNVILWVSTLEKNADIIAQTQMGVMEKIFKAVYGGDLPVMEAGINDADYFDPAPNSPNVGLMRVIISMTVEEIDDCY
jgi:hypothetical protein